MVIGGRALKGISAGIFSSSLTLYVTEVFPAQKKGLATSVIQWTLTWGIMIMFYSSYLCSFIKNDLSFRIAWGAELLPGLALFIMSFFIPESPKWLVSRSRWKEANKISRNLKHAKIYSVPETEVENTDAQNESDENFKETKEALDLHEKRLQKCSYSDLFKKELKKHVWVGILTQVFTQLSGIGVLMYYMVFICEMIGMKGDVKLLSSSIQYIINVIFTIFPILWIDSLRRKDVLVYGTTSLACCISIIGVVMICFGREIKNQENESLNWLVDGFAGTFTLAVCFLFVAIFSSSLSCAAWLYTNEILPLRAKAKGSATCMAFSWTINCLLTFVTPILLKYIKCWTFLIFGVCGFAGAFIIGFLFPETHGKTEEEIRYIFGAETSSGGASNDGPQTNDIEAHSSILNEKGDEIEEVPLDRNPGGTNQQQHQQVEQRERRRGIVIQNNDNTTNLGGETLRNSESERTKLSLPRTQLKNYHLDIIQHSESPSTNSNSHSELDTNKQEKPSKDSSPFFRSLGGPFDKDTDLISTQQDIEGTGEAQSTSTDAFIHDYYGGGDGSSPFLKYENKSPFK